MKASNAKNKTLRKKSSTLKENVKIQKFPHKRYPYNDAVVGLVWSNDSESYGGSSIAIDRVSHAREVKSDDTESNTMALQVGGWA